MNLKKLTIFFLAFFMIGCSSINPEKEIESTATAFIEAYKSQDEESINATTAAAFTMTPLDTTTLSAYKEWATKTIDKLLDYTYIIESVNHNDNFATITIVLTTYDVITPIQKGKISVDAYLADENKTSEELQAYKDNKTYMQDTFQYLEEAEQTQILPVTLSLEKIDGEWKISNPQSFDAIFRQQVLDALN